MPMPQKRQSLQYSGEAKQIKARRISEINAINDEGIEFVEVEEPKTKINQISNDNFFNTRLAQWFSNHNISNSASTELLQLLSEKITDLPKECDTLFLQEPNNNNMQDNAIKEILGQLRRMEERQKHMNVKLNAKMDHVSTELLTIRRDLSFIKSNISKNTINTEIMTLPRQPFSTIEEFEVFEKSLEDDVTFNIVVSELQFFTDQSHEKFIRNCWRKILTDEVAQYYSWRGTASKKCIKASLITLAIRTAFKNKFSLDDSEFDKVSQKHFQYAQDRILKHLKYEASKSTDADS